MKQYLEACKIINVRGLKGEMKADSFCDSPDILCEIKTLYFDDSGKNPVNVITAKTYKGFAYLTLESIDTVEKANMLRNKILYADREEIPVDDGSFFIEDLLGLTVYDADSGKEYGKVIDVFNRGASDIYTVEKDGSEYFLPAVDEFIIEIDLEKGIAVRPIPGIFDEAEKV